CAGGEPAGPHPPPPPATAASATTGAAELLCCRMLRVRRSLDQRWLAARAIADPDGLHDVGDENHAVAADAVLALVLDHSDEPLELRIRAESGVGSEPENEAPRFRSSRQVRWPVGSSPHLAP